MPVGPLVAEKIIDFFLYGSYLPTMSGDFWVGLGANFLSDYESVMPEFKNLEYERKKTGFVSKHPDELDWVGTFAYRSDPVWANDTEITWIATEPWGFVKDIFVFDSKVGGSLIGHVGLLPNNNMISDLYKFVIPQFGLRFYGHHRNAP